MVAARLFDPAAGRQFVDRYELIGEIASGGMATVYLARTTGVGGFQRLFALKRLHPHLALDAEFIEMFLDEARLAASIHHTNVVPILEVAANEAIGYYLVMEYIEGDTLARVLARAGQRRQSVPQPILLRVALDLLAGLHAAHELRDGTGKPLNLVHRDVSPQNVLVGFDGIARITDFGVARAASRMSATRVGQLKGKVAYMAPEQAQGADEVDRRADLFSAGVLIWEALAARRLFKAENEAATLARVMATAVPALSLINPDVSEALSGAIMRVLEREPAARYATAAEFADALEAAVGKTRVATPRELGAFVEALLNDEAETQREAVRLWLLRNEPSPASARSGSIAPPSIAPPSLSTIGASSITITETDSQSRSRRAPSQPSRSWRGVVLAALFAAVGAGAFYTARTFMGSPEPENGPAKAVSAPSQPNLGVAGLAKAPPALVPSAVAEPAPVAAPSSGSSAAPSNKAPDTAAAGNRTRSSRTAGSARARRKKGSEPVPQNPYR